MTGHSDGHRRQTADVVRELIGATGFRLAQLAEATNYSKQSWSAFQRGERAVPPEALEALIAVADHVPPALVQRARMLLAAQGEAADAVRREGDAAGPPSRTEPPAASPASSAGRRRAMAGVLTGLVLAGSAGAAGYRLSGGSPAVPAPGPTAGRTAGRTAIDTSGRLCAHVVRQPAGVFSRPSRDARPVKYKYTGDRVELLDRPGPPGWVAVRTPRDRPGMNWMPADALTPPAPCTPA
jgi:transcriptional regulator with XRE-family HTH domain